MPGEPAYEEAYLLGRLLAGAGFAISTGGYGGIMAAASQGGAEHGAHIIGVTSRHFDRYGEEAHGVNQWVAEERKFLYFRERLLHTVDISDAAIALRGGIGTLLEVALMWNFMVVGEDRQRPIILIGDHWKTSLLAYADKDEFIKPSSMELLHFVDTPQEAVAILDGFFRPSPRA